MPTNWSLANIDDETAEELENLIYNQISNQETEMRACFFENSEEEMEIPIKIPGEVPGIIGACFSNPNGDCLYYSLTHQLFHHKMDSKDHEDATHKLREDVVQHIENILSFFQPILEARIIDETSGNITDNPASYISEKVKNLIVGLHERVWGGMETIFAVSQLYSVNIVIFNEEGSSYIIGGFNPKYKKSLLIAYCYFAQKKTLNHYNSVTKLGDDNCFKCMRFLLKNAAQDTNISIVEILVDSVTDP